MGGRTSPPALVAYSLATWRELCRQPHWYCGLWYITASHLSRLPVTERSWWVSSMFTNRHWTSSERKSCSETSVPFAGSLTSWSSTSPVLMMSVLTSLNHCCRSVKVVHCARESSTLINLTAWSFSGYSHFICLQTASTLKAFSICIPKMAAPVVRLMSTLFSSPPYLPDTLLHEPPPSQPKMMEQRGLLPAIPFATIAR